MAPPKKTREALDRLKASRAGESRAAQHQVRVTSTRFRCNSRLTGEQRETANQDNLVYDVVDEGVYQKIVHQRLLRDDFIEIDQDLGYDDNGEDDGFQSSSDNEIERDVEKVKKVPALGTRPQS